MAKSLFEICAELNMAERLKDFVARVKGYVEGTTPGPWTAVMHDEDQYGVFQEKYKNWTTQGLFSGDYDGIASTGKNDAEFIAQSRTDLPRALEIIEEQEKELEDWSNGFEGLMGSLKGLKYPNVCDPNE